MILNNPTDSSQDPINGAQQAGSWACRETFVAVVTSNLPMIFPLVRRLFSPLLSTIRSYSSKITGNYATGTSRSDHIRLEDKNPRRGMGPRSVNPLTNFTFTESEERIVEPQNPSASSQHTTGTSPPQQSGIMKEVKVSVTEERKSRSDFPSEESLGQPGDFYLVEQARRSEEAQRNASRKEKRASVNYLKP